MFSYYKPGSRCEIETWRGCPTLNKFETEEECTNICIFIDTNDADIMPLRGAVNGWSKHNMRNFSKFVIYLKRNDKSTSVIF